MRAQFGPPQALSYRLFPPAYCRAPGNTYCPGPLDCDTSTCQEVGPRGPGTRALGPRLMWHPTPGASSPIRRRPVLTAAHSWAPHPRTLPSARAPSGPSEPSPHPRVLLMPARGNRGIPRCKELLLSSFYLRTSGPSAPTPLLWVPAAGTPSPIISPRTLMGPSLDPAFYPILRLLPPPGKHPSSRPILTPAAMRSLLGPRVPTPRTPPSPSTGPCFLPPPHPAPHPTRLPDSSPHPSHPRSFAPIAINRLESPTLHSPAQNPRARARVPSRPALTASVSPPHPSPPRAGGQRWRQRGGRSPSRDTPTRPPFFPSLPPFLPPSLPPSRPRSALAPSPSPAPASRGARPPTPPPRAQLSRARLRGSW